jgi:hypothetical protein
VLAAIVLTLVIAALVEAGLPLPVAVLAMVLPPTGIVLSAILTGRDPSLPQIA